MAAPSHHSWMTPSAPRPGWQAIASPLNNTAGVRAASKLGVPLRIDGRVDRVEGRKVFVRCELLEPPGRLLAEGEGIFLQLEDGRYE